MPGKSPSPVAISQSLCSIFFGFIGLCRDLAQRRCDEIEHEKQKQEKMTEEMDKE